LFIFYSCFLKNKKRSTREIEIEAACGNVVQQEEAFLICFQYISSKKTIEIDIIGFDDLGLLFGKTTISNNNSTNFEIN